MYMLTALAIAPTATTVNKAKRMIQYEVAKIALPPVPSALTLAGPTPNASFPNSNNYYINGNDVYAAGADPANPNCGGINQPAIGTVQDVGSGGQTATDVATASRNSIITDLNASGVKTANYTGADACSPGVPDVQNVQNTANSLYSTVTGLNSVVQNVQNAATKTYSGATSLSGATFGTSSSPKVTVVNGDLTLSGTTTGAGILLVTGALNFKGNFTFDGVIMVIGSGVFAAGGGGSGNFTGAVIVANIGGNTTGCSSGSTTNCYATNPIEANLNSPPVLGTPVFNFNGGGGNGLQYSSCAIDLANSSASYTVIARREITY